MSKRLRILYGLLALGVMLICLGVVLLLTRSC
jgi:hypothetical protein